MGRPELPIGTWGKIRIEQLGPKKYRARARYRDYDGKTRDVEATASTGPAAETALKVKLRDRTTPNDDEITRDTRLTRLAELWLEEITDEDRIAPQTRDWYAQILRTQVLPAVGELRVREATVGRLDRFLRAVARQHPASARGSKVVLSQMMGMAARHGAVPTNPVRDTSRLRQTHHKGRTVRALTTEHLDTVRAAIRKWQEPVSGKPGPRRTGDLADVVDLMLATGARIGEALAVRWQDLDLTGERPTVTISGTIIYLKGQGFFRQDWTKSDAGYRTVVLPRFAVAMLQNRHHNRRDTPHNAVFPSRRGTWMSPHNTRRQWRQARADTGLDWVVPHTFRKTVATLINDEADTRTAAAQLGHADEGVTATYYIARPAVVPDSSRILEQLGTDHPGSEPDNRGH